jgi:hypothetical protein
VHELDPGECRGGRAKGFEPQRRPRHPLYRAMVLFDDVVQIFPSPDFDIRLVVRIVALDRRGVGAALIDCDLLRRAVLTDRSAQEPTPLCDPAWLSAGSPGGAGLVDGPIEIFPGAFDLHICLIQPPAGPDRPLAGPGLTLQLRRVFDDPTIER